jgi:hypothetical protein
VKPFALAISILPVVLLLKMFREELGEKDCRLEQRIDPGKVMFAVCAVGKLMKEPDALPAPPVGCIQFSGI